jgi:acyl carrier protein
MYGRRADRREINGRYHMDILEGIRESLSEILDLDREEVTPETYIMRDLEAESIDLLELSVALNSRFKVEINDDQVFLRTLRVCLNNSNGNGTRIEGLSKEFPFLSGERIKEVLEDLDGGPVLKVKDLAAYIEWRI